jgi:hypothetical protein
MSDHPGSGVQPGTASQRAPLSPSLDPSSELFLAGVAHLRNAQGVLECWLRGGSMGRAVPAGSRIRIAFTDPRSYRTGQVVAVLNEGRICVHRVVYRGRWRAARSCLITRGDRCILPDPPVDAAAVLGPVTAFSQADGSWTPPGGPERRDPAARALAFMAVAILAVLVETDVGLAHWVVARSRRALRPVRTGVSRLFRGTRPAG